MRKILLIVLSSESTESISLSNPDSTPIENNCRKRRRAPIDVICSIDKQEEISVSVAKFFARQMIDPSVVSSDEFCDMIHAAEPAYEVPTEHEIQQRYKLAYASAREAIERELMAAQNVALSIYTWSSAIGETYATTMAHFIDGSCSIKHFNLSTVLLLNGKSLQMVLEDTMETWKFSGKATAVIHDEIQSIALAGVVTQLPLTMCAAHNLNKVIHDMLNESEEMEEVLEKDSATINHFNEGQTAISVLNEFPELEKQFRTVIEELRKSNAPTLSLVRPLLHALKTIHLEVKPEDKAKIKKLKMAALKSINSRFDFLSPELTAAHFASFYDPRFKSLDHETAEIKNKIKVAVRDEIEKSAEAIDVAHVATDPSINENRGLNFILKRKSSTTSQLDLYFGETEIPAECDPLEWWKNQKIRFPLIFREAQKYLGIPATTASSGKTCSIAGQMVAARRTAIRADNVDTLMFLSENFHLWSEK